MRYWQQLLILSLLLPAISWSESPFPQLSGRVVDEAGIISASTQQTLNTLLAEHEQQKTNQVVVVTVKTLHGMSIEDYAYQLGNLWGIGQKDKNNGVLLIIAPNERKVRIEVGLGLERILGNAKCKQIIESDMIPAFKAGLIERGILQGVISILSVLNSNGIQVKLFAVPEVFV
jgi:uncharacterized protein